MIATSSFPHVRLLDTSDPLAPLRPFLVPWCYRQLTGECSALASDLQTWTAVFDESSGEEGHSEEGSLLTLSMCAPFGEYELELQTDSYSSSASGMQEHTSWKILNGSDEVR